MTTTAKIKLTAEDKTSRAFTSLRGRLGKASKSLGGLKTALLGVAGVAGFGKLISSGLDAADQIDKLSKATGFSVSALSELKHAADLSGVGFTELTTGMTKMQKSLDDADRGLSTAKDALDAMGLSIGDIKGLEPDRQFEIIAGAIAGIEDPTKKVATAMNIFGRAGAKLIPMLNEGEDGIKAMREEAVDLGGVLSQDMVDASADAKDAWARLKTAASGVVNKLTAALAPALIVIFNWLAEKIPAAIKRVNRAWDTFTDKISDAVDWLQIKFIGATIKFKLAVRGMTSTLIVFMDAVVVASEFFGVAEEKINDWSTALNELWWKQTAEIEQLEAEQHALRNRNETGLHTIVITHGQKQATEDLTEATDELTTAAFTSDEALKHMQKTLEDAGLEAKTASGFVNDLYSGFSSLFSDALKGDIKSFTEFASRAFNVLIDAMIKLVAEMLWIATFKWIFRLLFPEFAYFATGGKFTVGPQGMGPVTAPGYASGGSFMVGGQGNADSQLVGFRATPGERVTVETPDQQRASNRRDQAGVIAELKMLRHDLANVITRPIVGQLARGQMAMAGGARH